MADGTGQPERLAKGANNSRELSYRSGDAVMSVPVETSATFTFRNPVMLFKGDYAPSLGGRNYDVSP